MDAASFGHKTATTINGVVINIHGDSHSTKVGKRVRREASFRVPPPPSFNGAGRASSPTSLSSASGSPYPGAPPPMTSVPVESVRARALQAVEFYNSSVGLNPSNNNPANNSNNNASNGNNETYKSLGDVFGIQAAVSSINNNSKMSHARSVTDVYKHVPLRAHSNSAAHAHHRVSTYSNVSVPVQSSANRFGSSDMRASYNEQRKVHANYNNYPARSIVYKSNSSLDLDHEVAVVQEAVSSVNLNYNHRTFGSQGSINDLKSFDGSAAPPPAAVSTLQRRSHANADVKSEASSVLSDTSSQSPKINKKKIGLFGQQQSLFKKFKVSKESGSQFSNTSEANSSVELISQSAERQAMLDDRHRRRFFSHYDIGSLCASLNIASKIKSQERRNTQTGASAASAALRGCSVDHDTKNEDIDHGDHISNDLVLSCPYFRNEVGGENERSVALSRGSSQQMQVMKRPLDQAEVCSSHTPQTARGFCLLDTPETYWKNGYCPYEHKKVQQGPTGKYVIERIDCGSSFYKNHFYGQDHQNWFGIDEALGAVAVSLRREKVPQSLNGNQGETSFIQPRNIDPEKEGKDQWMYRILVRTSDLLPLRGCVLEESIPALRSEKIKSLPTKEVLEFVCPELQLSSLHLGIQSGPCEDELIRLDEAYVQNRYKVGVMYCRNGQQTEEEMYNNEEGGPAFNEFLELIGQKVRLKGFNKYKAGLCNKGDTTGLYSIYTEYQSNEIMFHVSTLLPYTPNNKQQLPRKRYIGNDIVTIVFQEPDAKPFIPNLKSQFQHVFIVVRALPNAYAVSVSRAKSVPMFGPPLPPNGLFKKDKAFAEFLACKIINAENAAHLSDKFVGMAIRTRKELLNDLAKNYVTATTLDSGHKFSLFPSSRKKDKSKPRFTPDCAGLRGALSWRVVAEDCSGVHTTLRSHSREVDAILGISPDSIVLIQDNVNNDILFLTATKSVIGWTALQNSIRIYFHQGEAVILHSKDWESEDMSEISQRLKAVTNGAPTQEFTLRRNQLGQLGFHVQHDGLITEVENFGYAWQTGLRQGSRLVEICKHPVTALTHEQMVDLLKTSMTVIVTVIPPHPDGSPRKGCHLMTCNHAYGENNQQNGGDYENITNATNASQQQPSNDKTVFMSGQDQQRSLSPPRSSNSSGYGTGSSRKSSYVKQPPFNLLQQQQQQKHYGPLPRQTGHHPSGKTGMIQETMTGNSSTSSGGNSGDERWYDFGDAPPSSSENSPPPLPNRLLGGGKGSAFQKVVNNNTSNVIISGTSVLSNVTVNANSGSSANNSNTSSPSIYQHPPPPTKVLPLNGAGQNGPKRITRKYSYPSQQNLEEKREAKVTYLTEFELNNQPNISRAGGSEFVHHHNGNHVKNGDIGAGSTSGHHRYHMRSEDELSAVSTISASSNMSPPSRRRLIRQATAPSTTGNGNTTPSTCSSRNESPRFPISTKDPNSDSNYGVVKMKKSSARLNPNRNSASLHTSTLQEDLMKLIGQDFEHVGMKLKDHKTKTPQHPVRRSKSRETLISANGDHEQANYMARPATVISNTSGSSATSGNSNNLFTSPTSPSKRTNQQAPENQQAKLPLPDSRSMDWNSLVNTATKAINTDDETTIVDLENDPQRKEKSTTKDAIPAEERLSQLLERLESLEYRLNSESRQKTELADEVAQLREENQRLQEESATAAQQLRRFTEWFFQTIEKA